MKCRKSRPVPIVIRQSGYDQIARNVRVLSSTQRVRSTETRRAPPISLRAALRSAAEAETCCTRDAAASRTTRAARRHSDLLVRFRKLREGDRVPATKSARPARTRRCSRVAAGGSRRAPLRASGASETMLRASGCGASARAWPRAPHSRRLHGAALAPFVRAITGAFRRRTPERGARRIASTALGARFAPSARPGVKVIGFSEARVAEFRRRELHKASAVSEATWPRALERCCWLDPAGGLELCASRTPRRQTEGSSPCQSGAPGCAHCSSAGSGRRWRAAERAGDDGEHRAARRACRRCPAHCAVHR
jgi:hypothetical protein